MAVIAGILWMGRSYRWGQLVPGVAVRAVKSDGVL
jgi:hypothetical protein